MTRKSGLDSGHSPPTAILDKNGQLHFGSGSPFRGLAFPIDLVSYESGTFDIIKNEAELRAAIERIARVLGKSFDADTVISNAMQSAPVRARSEYADKWASQALHVGFLSC